MQSAEPQATYDPITILDDNELISRVIEKHKKFIVDYSAEFDELEKTLEQNRSEFHDISKELDALETRVIVLREKRHQLYNQARKLRIRLLDPLNELEPALHIENEIMDIENRLQNAHLTSEEEYDGIERICILLSEKFAKVQNQDEHQKKTISSIVDILETAKASRKELESVVNTPNKLKQESTNLVNAFDEMETRKRWLDRRIDLHKNALEYWENEAKGRVS